MKVLLVHSLVTNLDLSAVSKSMTQGASSLIVVSMKTARLVHV